MIKLLYLIEDDFQSQNAAKCDLLIHIGLETFQYAIIDKVRDELRVLAEYKIPSISKQTDLIIAIEKLPENSREFKFPYNKIKISMDSLQFTLIPDELYHMDQEKEYAKFISPLLPSEILRNTISSAKIKNIFAVNPDLNIALKQFFHNPQIFNQASTFVESIIKTYPGKKDSSIYIDIHSNHIQTACFYNSELSFYNLFECINPDEFNYFVLNMIDTLGLNTELTQVILSGNVSQDDEYYQRIRKYFNDITFADSRLIVNFPQKFNKVLSETYFSLISLDQCE